MRTALNSIACVQSRVIFSTPTCSTSLPALRRRELHFEPTRKNAARGRAQARARAASIFSDGRRGGRALEADDGFGSDTSPRQQQQFPVRRHYGMFSTPTISRHSGGIKIRRRCSEGDVFVNRRHECNVVSTNNEEEKDIVDDVVRLLNPLGADLSDDVNAKKKMPPSETHGHDAEPPDSLSRDNNMPVSNNDDGQEEPDLDLVHVLEETGGKNLLDILDQHEILLLHQTAAERSRAGGQGGKGGSKRDRPMICSTGLTVEEEEEKESANNVDGTSGSRKRKKRRGDAQKFSPSAKMWSREGNVRVVRQEQEEATSVSMVGSEDEGFMKEALVEAEKAAIAGEVPVGAVIVQKGQIIARAHNRVESAGDPTAHAEMLCIQAACKRRGNWRLTDATLYATLEPCPMCAGAILQSRIKGLVWGSRNTLLGADGSWVNLFPESVEEDINEDLASESEREPSRQPRMHPFHTTLVVRRGVLANDCSKVMRAFFQGRRKGKPSSMSNKPVWLPLSAWVLYRRLLHWWSLLVRS